MILLSALVRAHSPPDPPEQTLGSMSPEEMTQMMQMDDSHRFGTILFDQLEWQTSAAQRTGAWDAEAWYGGDLDKVWLRTEGLYNDAGGSSASAELLWDRTVSQWWSLQTGVRNDFGSGPSRTWMALGLEGLAPYWFETEATLYLGESGRVAARIKTEYELYLTQRLVLQPKAEVNAYAKADPATATGSGWSDLELGARMRYEFRRELAPYVGVNWARLFGSTADLARSAGRDASELEFVAGVRFWL
jgi:copper resistance protein B